MLPLHHSSIDFGDAKVELYFANAKKNPEKYKDENQSGTNGDIGIGTDGLPVNMDWWNARIINENEIALGNYDGCGFNVGYSGDIIDGKIVGKVPEYVKKSRER